MRKKLKSINLGNFSSGLDKFEKKNYLDTYRIE